MCIRDRILTSSAGETMQHAALGLCAFASGGTTPDAMFAGVQDLLLQYSAGEHGGRGDYSPDTVHGQGPNIFVVG